MSDIWLFKSTRPGSDTLRLEGSPADLGDAFKGWVRTRVRTGTRKIKTQQGDIYKEPTVLVDGVLYYGRRLTGQYSDGVPCTPNCRKARGHTCQCSCQGKNHGIENRDMVDAIQEEDVIYIGWEKD